MSIGTFLNGEKGELPINKWIMRGAFTMLGASLAFTAYAITRLRVKTEATILCPSTDEGMRQAKKAAPGFRCVVG